MLLLGRCSFPILSLHVKKWKNSARCATSMSYFAMSNPNPPPSICFLSWLIYWLTARQQNLRPGEFILSVSYRNLLLVRPDLCLYSLRDERVKMWRKNKKKKNKTKELEQSEWALHDNKWQGSILPWEFAAHLQDMRPNKQALSDKNANNISNLFNTTTYFSPALPFCSVWASDCEHFCRVLAFF